MSFGQNYNRIAFLIRLNYNKYIFQYQSETKDNP